MGFFKDLLGAKQKLADIQNKIFNEDLENLKNQFQNAINNLTTPSQKGGPAAITKQAPLNSGGLSERIENLIEAALEDGVLTDKEREIILHRAEKEGEDVEEIEMILEARLAKRNSKQAVNAPTPASSQASTPTPVRAMVTEQVVAKNDSLSEDEKMQKRLEFIRKAHPISSMVKKTRDEALLDDLL